MIGSGYPIFASVFGKIIELKLIDVSGRSVFYTTHQFVKLDLPNLKDSLLHENRRILDILTLIVDSSNNLEDRCVTESRLFADFLNKIMRIESCSTCIRFRTIILGIIQITDISYPHALDLKDIVIDSYFIQRFYTSSD